MVRTCIRFLKVVAAAEADVDVDAETEDVTDISVVLARPVQVSDRETKSDKDRNGTKRIRTSLIVAMKFLCQY